uniref:Uncharacterized protein n=1 Tax=Ditylenchus dipsaci TaxID=166011 RepID=A0A915EER0_9BILA
MLMSLAFVPLSISMSARELKSYLLREEPSLEPVIMWYSSYYAHLCVCLHFRYIFGRAITELSPVKTEPTTSLKQLVVDYIILGIDHPTIGHFLGEMKKAQKHSDHSYEQCIMGQPAPKKGGSTWKRTKNSRSGAIVWKKNLIKYLRD